jgi:sulfate adenylyltransferase large subunit
MTDLLRLATAGSVDDGKSTLIGRLLLDAKAVLVDQLEHVEEASRRKGASEPDLALFTDGLRAEREQGITIDVAYRYFATARRRFVLADTPGHVQYTRNMVTGASNADLAIILVDARSGVVEQTRRHASIASLLRVPHLVVAVNKMDLVDWSEEVFDRIVREFSAFRERLPGIGDVRFLPISALHGDNVVSRSEATPWYEGPPLLEHLETVELSAEHAGAHDRPLRFPVQLVLRDPATDFRGYAGQIAGGSLQPGDPIVVLPSGLETTVASVETLEGPLDDAPAPLSVTVRLAEDVDVSRGDMLATPATTPRVTREIEADVCWMAETPLQPGARLLMKHTTATVRAIVDGIDKRLDVETLAGVAAPDGLALNDLGHIRLRTSRPLAVDPYVENRTTGAFILIDEATNDTVAAGMIR